MQALCGLPVFFLLFNCQTSEPEAGEDGDGVGKSGQEGFLDGRFTIRGFHREKLLCSVFMAMSIAFSAEFVNPCK